VVFAQKRNDRLLTAADFQNVVTKNKDLNEAAVRGWFLHFNQIFFEFQIDSLSLHFHQI
jgi:hypothetical protein